VQCRSPINAQTDGNGTTKSSTSKLMSASLNPGLVRNRPKEADKPPAMGKDSGKIVPA
jgi:hypothetical protein